MAKKVKEEAPAGSFYPTNIVDIDSLRPWPTNYLNHGEQQLQALQDSLTNFGQAKNVVTWRGYIVAGHGLVEAAKRLGWSQIEAKELSADLTEIQVEAYLIADNRTAELSTKNETLLGDMLHRIRAAGSLTAAVGYDSAQIDSKLRSLSQLGFVQQMEVAAGQAYTQAVAQIAAPAFVAPANPDGSSIAIAMPTAPGSPAPVATAAYVQLQFPLIAEQRDRVLAVLTHVQKTTGLTNSIQALVHLCEQYAQGAGL